MYNLDKALYDALRTDGSLITLIGGTRVYNSVAPRRATRPYVVFHQQAGREDNETPRRTARWWYTVKAVADTQSAAVQIADRIDAVLHDKSNLAVSGWSTAWWCARDDMVRYVETDEEGEFITHAGAVYEVRLCQE